jgi:hypothetical protein
MVMYDWLFFKGHFTRLPQNATLDDPTIPEAVELHISAPDSFDTSLNIELLLPREQGSTMKFACNLKSARSNPIGIANDNPILDSRMCIC